MILRRFPCYLTELAKPTNQGRQLLYDPPYKHQADAIEQILVRGKSLVIMTGTGSGKTQSLLLPIVGKLAIEGPRLQSPILRFPARLCARYDSLSNECSRERPTRPLTAACLEIRDSVNNSRPGRVAQPALHDTRAGPFILSFAILKKDAVYGLLRSERYYVRHLENASDPSSPGYVIIREKLIDELKKRRKMASQAEISLKWYGRSGTRWIDAEDRSIQALRSPLLTTKNSSQDMKSNRLHPMSSLRTIRCWSTCLCVRWRDPSSISHSDWLQDNPNEKFLLVLDEAHLYRGAAGSEVALLIRRLRKRSGNRS